MFFFHEKSLLESFTHFPKQDKSTGFSHATVEVKYGRLHLWTGVIAHSICTQRRLYRVPKLMYDQQRLAKLALCRSFARPPAHTHTLIIFVHSNLRAHEHTVVW